MCFIRIICNEVLNKKPVFCYLVLISGHLMFTFNNNDNNDNNFFF